jgi:hypothetical protein
MPAVMSAQSPEISVSGVGYVHYRYQLGIDSSLANPGHANNFDVERSYLTVSGKFANGIATRVTADVDGRDADENQLTFRLKYAFVAWTPNTSGLTYKLGMIHTPWIEWEESVWGYRMQSTVAMGRFGIVPASDFGVGIDGTWNDGGVDLQAGIYNGEGYDRELGDQGKDAAARISVRLGDSDLMDRFGGLRLTVMGQYGKANGGSVRSRLLGMLSWKSKRLTLAANYGITRDSTGINSPDAQGTVASAYAVYTLPGEKIGLIARVDRHDPDSKVTPTGPSLDTGIQTRWITGVSYRLSPNVRVLLDADVLSLENGSPDNNYDASRRSLFFHTEFRF